MAANCLAYKSPVSFTICLFPVHLILQLSVTNPIAAPSLNKTHFTFHTVLNPFSYPKTPGLRMFPEAVTLLDTGIRANNQPHCVPSKALPHLSNSLLRFYPESKIWPKAPLHRCPPLPSLYPCYSFSSQCIHST